MSKLIRITTVPISLQKLINGQMAFMSSSGFDVYMISSPFSEYRILEEAENSRFEPVAMTRTISPLQDLRSLFNVYRILKRLKPEIVHTHTPKAGLIGMLASRIAGVPIRLHTVAGLPLMETRGMKRKILNLVEKLTYACAVKVYPNSKNLRDFIIKESLCSERRLKVIGDGSSNGINTELFKRNSDTDSIADGLRNKYGITDDDFTFIFVGRLVKDKGIEELVYAFTILSKKFSNVKLLLVGPEEKTLDPLSDECLDTIGIYDSIISVGYQSDVRPFLSMSKALVFPSYREGFPNAPMQAGCFDLPSIVTNINGCNEIVIHEENGLIIPVKDSRAILVAMERLLTDRQLYERMSSNSRMMIVERYEQHKIWELILEEYKEHLNKKNIVHPNI